MTEDERAAIERAADLVDVSRWPPLNDAERDLVSRAFVPLSIPDANPPRAA